MQSVKIEKLVVGPLMTNCYILSDSGECAVIDAGAEGARIAGTLKEIGCDPKYIFATHGHFDHISGVKVLREKYSCNFLIHREDLKLLMSSERSAKEFAGIELEGPGDPDNYIDESEYRIGNAGILPLHTPGHTPGSVSFLCGGNLFSGDTLFRGSIGRMDYGGSRELMVRTIEKMKSMDDSLVVYPGHGPPTTIGEEKMSNPFFNDIKI